MSTPGLLEYKTATLDEPITAAPAGPSAGSVVAGVGADTEWSRAWQAKSAEFDLSGDPEGTFWAIVAVTGVKDDVDDVIVPGAFRRTLRERGMKGVKGHDWNRPTAVQQKAMELLPRDPRLPDTLADNVTPWPEKAGVLLVKARYILGTPEGRAAYETAKAFEGTHAFSIGYKVTEHGAQHKAGVRYIRDLDVYEFSDVLHGANRYATLQAVKAAPDDGIEAPDPRDAPTGDVARADEPPDLCLDDVWDAERKLALHWAAETKSAEHAADPDDPDDPAFADGPTLDEADDDLEFDGDDEDPDDYPDDEQVKSTSFADVEHKIRRVHDAAYWGKPVGTPITRDMKPEGRRRIGAARRAAQGDRPTTRRGMTAAGVLSRRRVSVADAERFTADEIHQAADRIGARGGRRNAQRSRALRSHAIVRERSDANPDAELVIDPRTGRGESREARELRTASDVARDYSRTARGRARDAKRTARRDERGLRREARRERRTLALANAGRFRREGSAGKARRAERRTASRERIAAERERLDADPTRVSGGRARRVADRIHDDEGREGEHTAGELRAAAAHLSASDDADRRDRGRALARRLDADRDAGRPAGRHRAASDRDERDDPDREEHDEIDPVIENNDEDEPERDEPEEEESDGPRPGDDDDDERHPDDEPPPRDDRVPNVERMRPARTGRRRRGEHGSYSLNRPARTPDGDPDEITEHAEPSQADRDAADRVMSGRIRQVAERLSSATDPDSVADEHDDDELRAASIYLRSSTSTNDVHMGRKLAQRQARRAESDGGSGQGDETSDEPDEQGRDPERQRMRDLFADDEPPPANPLLTPIDGRGRVRDGGRTDPRPGAGQGRRREPVGAGSKAVPEIDMETSERWAALPEGKARNMVRRVQDAAYWGRPVGTVITPGMKPTGARARAGGRDRGGSTRAVAPGQQGVTGGMGRAGVGGIHRDTAARIRERGAGAAQRARTVSPGTDIDGQRRKNNAYDAQDLAYGEGPSDDALSNYGDETLGKVRTALERDAAASWRSDEQRRQARDAIARVDAVSTERAAAAGLTPREGESPSAARARTASSGDVDTARDNIDSALERLRAENAAAKERDRFAYDDERETRIRNLEGFAKREKSIIASDDGRVVAAHRGYERRGQNTHDKGWAVLDARTGDILATGENDDDVHEYVDARAERIEEREGRNGPSGDDGGAALADVPADGVRGDPDRAAGGVLPGSERRGERGDPDARGAAGRTGPAERDVSAPARADDLSAGGRGGAGGAGDDPAGPGDARPGAGQRGRGTAAGRAAGRSGRGADDVDPGVLGRAGGGDDGADGADALVDPDSDAGLAADGVTEEDTPPVDTAVAQRIDAIPDDASAFRPESMDDLAPAGVRAKLDANMAALRTVRELQRAEPPRAATPAEQAVLARWAGWGSLPKVFDDTDPTYARERDELHGLLNEAEWNEARRNTLNAHYTDAKVTAALWDAVTDLGFDGGRVLEPGSGSGNFIGFAPDGAQMVGVEKDSTTAAISKYLYPGSTIRNESFGDTKAPEGTFDAAIGNVPFGRYQVRDPQYNRDGKSIHNHFIVKSLALTRPGGIVAMLTSRYTLDAMDDDARAEMAKYGDLVGAVRLPTGSHRRASGTDVIEDILIFRRREDGAEPAGDQSWLTASQQDVNGFRIPVSDYFTAHPEHVLGEVDAEGGQYGTGDMIVRGDRNMTDLSRVLGDIVTRARADGLTATPRGDDEPRPELLPADSTRHEGHVQAEPDGSFTQAINGVAVPFEVPNTQRQEVAGLVGIRETLSALLTEEGSHREETPRMAELRAELNSRYDAYVAAYGPISRYGYNSAGARNPARAPRTYGADPASAMIRALEENYVTDGSLEGKGGTVDKAAIFRKRSSAPRELATTADNPQDAVNLSIDTYGEINLPAIATMLGTDEADARRRLGSLVHEVPPLSAEEEDHLVATERARMRDGDVDEDTELARSATEALTGLRGQLVPAAEFLSGNVRRKLAIARAAARRDERFAPSVAALEAVLPAELGPDEIDGRLGAVWIPPSDVAAFVREILGNASGVEVSNVGGRWTVTGPRKGDLARSQWGTEHRPTSELVESLLNQQQIKITYTDPDTKKSVENVEGTIAAQEKAQEIQDRFQEWIWEDADRARRLATDYNDRFNGIALRSYDDTPRTFPGMAAHFEPRPHQVAAVNRIVSEPTALLGHVVGAGKTAEMTIGTAELKRLGMARKPAIIVPNHMLEQFTREYLEIYPGAKVLSASTESLKGKSKADTSKRREFIARAATGDWDVVIMTQTAFQSIPMSKARVQEYVDGELAEMRNALDEANRAAAGQDDDSAAKKSIKKMEQAIASAEADLQKKVDTATDDAALTFEQTGIDYLMVDEAHHYSNLRTMSRIQNAGADGSGQATDLHMKLGYLRSVNDSGRVATFATGTPIRNTVTQAYIMMRFLRPDILQEAGIDTFDEWAATFGEVVTEMELKPEGTGFRQTQRFAKFRNVPELLRIFHTFADIKLAEDLDLDTPTLVGGRAETVTVPAPDDLGDYIRDLGERARAVRDKEVEPEDDNMLKISMDGRKAALSMALVADGDGKQYDHQPGKIEHAADQILTIHDENANNEYPLDPKNKEAGMSPNKGGMQIVFLDMGTPKSERDQRKAIDDGSPFFDAYEKLRSELVARGMKRERIRFMHEARNDREKAELFAQARNGQIDVLVGSTERMGVGTNIQLRATALHHLDAPWRPSDVEQRDGRIVRQGNYNPNVRVLRYVTEGSFDAYMWQTLERKAKFINQIMKGSLDVREIEDVGDSAMSYAEVKALATGNPDLLAKAKVDAVRHRLEKSERTHNRTQTNMRNNVGLYTAQADGLDEDVQRYDAAIAARRPTAGDKFALSIGGERFTKRTDAGEALAISLRSAVSDHRWSQNPQRVIAEIGGHTAVVTKARNGDYLIGFDAIPGQVIAIPTDEVRKVNGTGLVTRLENFLAALDRRRDDATDRAAYLRNEVALMTPRIGQAFPKARELAAAQAKSTRLQTKMQIDARRAEEKIGREQAREIAERLAAGEDPDKVPYAALAWNPHVDTAQDDDPILGRDDDPTQAVEDEPDPADQANAARAEGLAEPSESSRREITSPAGGVDVSDERRGPALPAADLDAAHRDAVDALELGDDRTLRDALGRMGVAEQEGRGELADRLMRLPGDDQQRLLDSIESSAAAPDQAERVEANQAARALLRETAAVENADPDPITADELAAAESGDPDLPPGMTSARRAVLVALAEDYAGQYGGPGAAGGGGAGNAARYIMEGHAQQPDGSVDRAEWDWLHEYIVAHPDLLDRTPPTQAELQRRREDRTAAGRASSQAAREAFDRGEHDEALALVDAAERDWPERPGGYDGIRGHITAARDAAVVAADDERGESAPPAPSPASDPADPVDTSAPDVTSPGAEPSYFTADELRASAVGGPTTTDEVRAEFEGRSITDLNAASTTTLRAMLAAMRELGTQDPADPRVAPYADRLTAMGAVVDERRNPTPTGDLATDLTNRLRAYLWARDEGFDGNALRSGETDGGGRQQTWTTLARRAADPGDPNDPLALVAHAVESAQSSSARVPGRFDKQAAEQVERVGPERARAYAELLRAAATMLDRSGNENTTGYWPGMADRTGNLRATSGMTAQQQLRDHADAVERAADDADGTPVIRSAELRDAAPDPRVDDEPAPAPEAPAVPAALAPAAGHEHGFDDEAAAAVLQRLRSTSDNFLSGAASRGMAEHPNDPGAALQATIDSRSPGSPGRQQIDDVLTTARDDLGITRPPAFDAAPLGGVPDDVLAAQLRALQTRRADLARNRDVEPDAALAVELQREIERVGAEVNGRARAAEVAAAGPDAGPYTPMLSTLDRRVTQPNDVARHLSGRMIQRAVLDAPAEQRQAMIVGRQVAETGSLDRPFVPDGMDPAAMAAALRALADELDGHVNTVRSRDQQRRAERGTLADDWRAVADTLDGPPVDAAADAPADVPDVDPQHELRAEGSGFVSRDRRFSITPAAAPGMLLVHDAQMPRPAGGTEGYGTVVPGDLADLAPVRELLAARRAGTDLDSLTHARGLENRQHARMPGWRHLVRVDRPESLGRRRQSEQVSTFGYVDEQGRVRIAPTPNADVVNPDELAAYLDAVGRTSTQIGDVTRSSALDEVRAARPAPAGADTPAGGDVDAFTLVEDLGQSGDPIRAARTWDDATVARVLDMAVRRADDDPDDRLAVKARDALTAVRDERAASVNTGPGASMPSLPEPTRLRLWDRRDGRGARRAAGLLGWNVGPEGDVEVTNMASARQEAVDLLGQARNTQERNDAQHLITYLDRAAAAPTPEPARPSSVEPIRPAEYIAGDEQSPVSDAPESRADALVARDTGTSSKIRDRKLQRDGYFTTPYLDENDLVTVTDEGLVELADEIEAEGRLLAEYGRGAGNAAFDNRVDRLRTIEAVQAGRLAGTHQFEDPDAPSELPELLAGQARIDTDDAMSPEAHNALIDAADAGLADWWTDDGQIDLDSATVATVDDPARLRRWIDERLAETPGDPGMVELRDALAGAERGPDPAQGSLFDEDTMISPDELADVDAITPDELADADVDVPDNVVPLRPAAAPTPPPAPAAPPNETRRERNARLLAEERAEEDRRAAEYTADPATLSPEARTRVANRMRMEAGMEPGARASEMRRRADEIEAMNGTGATVTPLARPEPAAEPDGPGEITAAEVDEANAEPAPPIGSGGETMQEWIDAAPDGALAEQAEFLRGEVPVDGLDRMNRNQYLQRVVAEQRRRGTDVPEGADAPATRAPAEPRRPDPQPEPEYQRTDYGDGGAPGPAIGAGRDEMARWIEDASDDDLAARADALRSAEVTDRLDRSNRDEYLQRVTDEIDRREGDSADGEDAGDAEDTEDTGGTGEPDEGTSGAPSGSAAEPIVVPKVDGPQRAILDRRLPDGGPAALDGTTLTVTDPAAFDRWISDEIDRIDDGQGGQGRSQDRKDRRALVRLQTAVEEQRDEREPADDDAPADAPAPADASASAGADEDAPARADDAAPDGEEEAEPDTLPTEDLFADDEGGESTSEGESYADEIDEGQPDDGASPGGLPKFDGLDTDDTTDDDGEPVADAEPTDEGAPAQDEPDALGPDEGEPDGGEISADDLADAGMADAVEAAQAAEGDALGLIEADDGEFEVTEEVAARQARVSGMLNRAGRGELDPATMGDSELGEGRADLVGELRLQEAIRRRENQRRRDQRAQQPASAPAAQPAGPDAADAAPVDVPEPAPPEPETPKRRPGLAGAVEDLADAIASGDDDATTAAAARARSSLARSRGDSDTHARLGAALDALAAGEPGDADALRELAEQLRAAARAKRNDQAKARRLAKRLERERIRSLIGQFDAELRNRGRDPIEFGGPAPTATPDDDPDAPDTGGPPVGRTGGDSGDGDPGSDVGSGPAPGTDGADGTERGERESAVPPTFDRADPDGPAGQARTTELVDGLMSQPWRLLGSPDRLFAGLDADARARHEAATRAALSDVVDRYGGMVRRQPNERHDQARRRAQTRARRMKAGADVDLAALTFLELLPVAQREQYVKDLQDAAAVYARKARRGGRGAGQSRSSSDAEGD